MDITKIRSLAQAIIDETNAQQFTSNVIPVSAGASLQSAHDKAAEGSTLVLEPGVYPGTLTSKKKLIWMVKGDLPLTRSNPSFLPVTVRGSDEAVVNYANGAVFQGIGFKSDNPGQTLVTDLGTGLVLDRVVLLGDPVKGQHRGFLAHGVGARLVNSFVDECWLVGRDACAVGGWDGTKDLAIDNSYLGGGAQSVMFGGADAKTVDGVPNGIKITNSVLSKNKAWYTLNAQIKCAFELKAALNVVMQDCLLEYAGISGGSTGYSILLTPRNQDNTAPFSSVEHVLIERCLARYAGGAANLAGKDSPNVSGPLNDITFRNVEFTDIDPTAGPWKGQGRVFLVTNGPKGLVFDAVTVRGSNMTSTFYFDLVTPPTKMVVRNVLLPTSTYGVKIDNGGMGWKEVQAACPDAVIDLKATDVGAVGFPKV